MLYCRKCRSVSEDGIAQCPNCKSDKHMRQVNDEDFILLHRADQYTAETLESQFDAHAISYQLEPFAHGRLSYLYDAEVMPTDKMILVKYADSERAKELSGRLKEKMEADQQEQEVFEDMPIGKRVFYQALSVVLFIAVIIVLVLCSDSIANWLRAFFMGA